MEIKLSKNISGEDALAVVLRAVERHSAKTGLRVGIQDFCRVAPISRQLLSLYRHGTKPKRVGLAKIASGLRAWGDEVTITK
jgi:hypothetical protein